MRFFETMYEVSIKDMFANADYIVSATDFEQFILWKDYNKSQRRYYKKPTKLMNTLAYYLPVTLICIGVYIVLFCAFCLLG